MGFILEIARHITRLRTVQRELLLSAPTFNFWAFASDPNSTESSSHYISFAVNQITTMFCTFNDSRIVMFADWQRRLYDEIEIVIAYGVQWKTRWWNGSLLQSLSWHLPCVYMPTEWRRHLNMKISGTLELHKITLWGPIQYKDLILSV